MKNLKIGVVAICGLFLVSCESTTIQDVSGVVTNPTYNANIKAVMSAKCTGCHAGGNQYPNLETYTQVKEATQNGSLLCRLYSTCGNLMPQSGRLPQATIAMITTWADLNYREN